MGISAEHRSKFTAHHRQWWRLQMSKKFSSGTKNSKQISVPIFQKYISLFKWCEDRYLLSEPIFFSWIKDRYMYNWIALFVCFGLSSHSRIFHSFADVTIAGDGLQIFWRRHHYRWRDSNNDLCSHLLPLSSEGFERFTLTVTRDIRW